MDVRAGREHQGILDRGTSGPGDDLRGGSGKDIKGILKQPIRIGDYRLPWEFQTSLVQSFNLTAGVGAKTQVNSAIGLNVAVTFSDPSTWPSDRTKRPPQTHEFQLLVVHLGLHGRGRGRPAAVLD